MFENNHDLYRTGSGLARGMHIDICYHQMRIIEFPYCPTKLILTDILANSLDKDKFEELAKGGVRSIFHSMPKRRQGERRCGRSTLLNAFSKSMKSR